MSSEPDLYDLIRQLKTELEWAVKTGIIVEERARPPQEEPAPQLSASPPQRPVQQPPPPRAQPPAQREPPPWERAERLVEKPVAPQPPVPKDNTAEQALVQLGARPSLAAIRDVLGECT